MKTENADITQVFGIKTKIVYLLLEPVNTRSRGSRALAMRFVELGTMAVSLIQSSRAYKTVRLLR